MLNSETPLYALTVGQFKSLLNQEISIYKSETLIPIAAPEPNERFDIGGLAEYLKVSKTTIHAYKNRRVFPFYQTGRTVYFLKSEVDAALAVGKNKKGFKNA